MFKWAMKPRNAHLGVTANPARDVDKLTPNRKGGFPRWKPADLDKFEARHPVGTQARLALALLTFTGASRSDVVRLGKPMVRNGTLSWVRWKGRNKNPVQLDIPMLPELRTIIEATPVVGTTTFLVTQYGRPFTAEGFGNKMADWCRDAGLPGLNSHGVRKAAATRMADRGGSVHALMATFGWLDIKQAELYTRDAERKRLARDNAHLLGTESDQNFPTLDPKTPGGEVLGRKVE
jgi:integrase